LAYNEFGGYTEIREDRKDGDEPDVLFEGKIQIKEYK